MADEHDENEAGAAENAQPAQAAHHDAGKADMDKVTDFAEEKEMAQSTDLNQTMKLLTEQHKRDVEERAVRDRALAAVSVKAEDVQLIVTELEVSTQKAEQTLREQNGDLAAALAVLAN
ncbi:hypothetical protein CAOG_02766 [Capsaspora owczarzaki ATCC 30864]|uniref:Nascent polypeptide-associated complex subunit alpha-like UBA domain-containing protein n=1 Tax=Capsaspora owczarzaki (strain ATCC 30864) TaxID=595528 RepID=A0A0D2WN06_CAPO3|nr:hypothetical protein CAOG_02766 [Capsaspora owczarzaki ATCC 30864]KJE91658.1 hypothetical protein CAOG_002766 [Capsaspora owczarzaki ATCC 30864]|eukprot:XP_004349519.1 hypothetical protein CAOG_02766 [Capsaspora owczarzaki ATCC 30864]